MGQSAQGNPLLGGGGTLGQILNPVGALIGGGKGGGGGGQSFSQPFNQPNQSTITSDLQNQGAQAIMSSLTAPPSSQVTSAQSPSLASLLQPNWGSVWT